MEYFSVEKSVRHKMETRPVGESFAGAGAPHAIEGANRPLRHFAFAKYAYPRFSLVIFADKAAGIFTLNVKNRGFRM